MQKVQIKNWGNSQAVRIPKNVIETLKLEENSSLELTVDEESKTIVLKFDENLTPYQKLMLKSSNKKTRKPYIWDRLEDEEKYYL